MAVEGWQDVRTTAQAQISDKEYEAQLYELQVELVKFQRDLIARGEKLAVVVEGRDGAGKDGTIKRIIEHLSPRETRVVALGKPTDRDRTSWYFQRFAPHLPAGGEFVLFNRSWYNRAGVEPVMGFCTEDEYKQFLQRGAAVRGDADARRHQARQILSRHFEGRAEGAARGTARRSAKAVEDQSRSTRPRSRSGTTIPKRATRC